MHEVSVLFDKGIESNTEERIEAPECFVDLILHQVKGKITLRKQGFNLLRAEKNLREIALSG